MAIAKETGRRLGMGTNMYPSLALLGDHKDQFVAALPIDKLIEKANGFAGVFPEHKYEIVKILQSREHTCGMTGDGVNDAPALKKADIGIAVADATDAARSVSDIVLTELGLSVIISAVLTSRAIFQRIKNYTLGFLLPSAFWRFNFPPFMVLVIAILNDVQPPESTYDLMIKDDLESSQALSCLQIETLVYACQRHVQHLPDGARPVFLSEMELVELQFHNSADVNEKDAIFNYRRKYLPTQQIMHLDAEKEMMSQRVALLGKFSAVREPNIRYLGLETRMLMVSDVQDIIKGINHRSSPP
ncbi:hypothetical protein LOK49_LG09G02032 [Camellia lanceoleosa]|uniref:Uncharacterized protein n=1 Tax=Camellia lanceoleosa TaxID=1840588 RepID=A0ACC0GM62_9ERIC|nr:hypothetical protein LOK49_LG09G02032 [Camellia lanceoleosa]